MNKFKQIDELRDDTKNLLKQNERLIQDHNNQSSMLTSTKHSVFKNIFRMIKHFAAIDAWLLFVLEKLERMITSWIMFLCLPRLLDSLFRCVFIYNDKLLLCILSNISNQTIQTNVSNSFALFDSIYLFIYL